MSSNNPPSTPSGEDGRVTTQVVDDVPVLRRVVPEVQRAPLTLGTDHANDGGEGQWAFNPFSAVPDNGIDVVHPEAVKPGEMGRFLRLSSQNHILAEWGGITRDPGVDVLDRMQAMIDHASTDRKPLVLRGGNPRDAGRAYTVSNSLRITASGFTLLVDGGVARFVGTAQNGSILDLADGLTDVALLGDYWFDRSPGAMSGMQMGDCRRVRIGRLGSNGGRGALLGSRGGNYDVQVESLEAWDMATNGSTLNPEPGDELWRIGYAFGHDGQEVMDSYGIRDFQIGRMVGVNCGATCELSSAQNIQIGQIWHRGFRVGNPAASSPFLIKNEVGNTPSFNIQLGLLYAEGYNRWGFNITNTSPVPAGTDPSLFYVRDVHIESAILKSTVAGAGGVQLTCPGDRPQTEGVSIRSLRVDVPGRSMYVARTSVHVGQGDVYTRDPATPEAIFIDGGRLSGELRVRSFSAVSRIHNTGALASEPLRLVQRLAPVQERTDYRQGVTTENRPRGVSFTGATVPPRGILLLDFESVRDFVVQYPSTGSNVALVGNGDEMVFGIRARSSGVGFDTRGYRTRNVRFTGVSGGEAYLECTDGRAVVMNGTYGIRGSLRVRSGALASSLHGAANFGSVGDYDLDVYVEGSQRTGVVLSAVTGGRLGVRGGRCGTRGVLFTAATGYDLSPLRIEVDMADVGLDSPNFLLEVAEAHGGIIPAAGIVVRGASVTGADITGARTTNGLRVTSASALAQVLRYGSLTVNVWRHAGTLVSNEELIDGTANDPSAGTVTYFVQGAP
jgi:hypothetical protein